MNSRAHGESLAGIKPVDKRPSWLAPARFAASEWPPAGGHLKSTHSLQVAQAVWSSVASNFASISAGLDQAAATGTISVSSQNLLFSTNQTSGVAVFSLVASQLSGNTYNGQTFSNVQINVPSGVNYVINVVNIASGQTLFGSGVNFNSGLNDSQLLWNFEGNSSFSISAGGNFYGSILAPASTITDNTTINGQVVASAFVDQGVELHDTDFAVVSAVVPESRAFAGWAAGLCLAGIVCHRRLLRRRNRGCSPLT